MRSARALSALAASCLGLLLLPAAVARAPAADRGGVLRLVVSTDPGSIEPAFAARNYDGIQVMSATQLSLVSLCDAPTKRRSRFVPYGAVGLPKISRDGRTYVFRIRHGLRFSDGSPVTAHSFLAGFERVLDPRLQTPTAWLFEDVRGALAFTHGKARHVSGLLAEHDRFTIKLTQPAGDLVSRLAMPIVTAMPLILPVVNGGVEAPLPSAGPYYVKEYEPQRTARLVRNPYWRAGLFPSRPASVTEIEYLGRTQNEAAATVERGDADIATFASGESFAPDFIRDLAHRYGIDRTRFFARPRLGRVSVVFNFRSPVFRNNARLRRAVSFALDRRALARVHGPLAGRPTDQLLLPGSPGFRDWKLYPYKPNIAAARRLARGAVPRKDVVLYAPLTPWGPGAAAVIRANLAQVGLRVHIRTLPAEPLPAVLSQTPTPWDLALWSWNTNRDDPVVFINVPLDGGHIARPSETANFGRFNDPRWNARMRSVGRVVRGRDTAYARLDHDLMQNATPLAPYLVENALTLFSDRVGCVSWLADGWPNLAGLCIKRE